MRITAREQGRRLVVTAGGPEPDMTDAEAVEAEAEAVRVTVPPVTAAVGTRIWSLYAGILFYETENTAEVDATMVVRLATGSWWDDTTPEPERARAEAQYGLLESLRWEETNLISQVAIYWNIQGGGIDAVNALLGADGNPKAQEIVVRHNQMWNVLSQLRTLSSTAADDETPAPADTNGTSTRPNTSQPSEPDVAGSPNSETTDRQKQSPAA